MTGEIDHFDFMLAQDLGMSLAQVRELSNLEVVEWKAFYKYRDAMEDLAARTQRGSRIG